MRVLLADDSLVVRERLAGLLREVSGVSIVAQTHDVPGTLEAIREHRPAVVILDLNMPGGSGLDVLQWVQTEKFPVTVFVLTNYPILEYEQKARDYGARAFLDKSHEFMKAVELVRQLADATPQPAARDGGSTR